MVGGFEFKLNKVVISFLLSQVIPTLYIFHCVIHTVVQ